MTRREQIEKKAIEISVNTDRPYVAAIMAIEWADANPKHDIKAAYENFESVSKAYASIAVQLSVAMEFINTQRGYVCYCMCTCQQDAQDVFDKIVLMNGVTDPEGSARSQEGGQIELQKTT